MAKKSKKAVKKSAKKIVKKVSKKTPSKKGMKKQSPVRKPVKKAVKKKQAKSSKPAAAKALPNMISISPYLTFPGNCEEAFNLYKSVFRTEFHMIQRFKDMPPMEGEKVNPDELEKIMHVSLPIGRETALMGSDSSEAYGHATVIGNNFSISINATSQQEADRLYNELSEGGMQTMPMNKTFWGSYFGMLTDKFGIQWMISFDQRP